MRKVREVLRLRHALSLSYREISEALGVGKTAAGEIVRRAEVVGLTWPLPQLFDDGELERRLFTAPGEAQPQRPAPDWAKLHEELKRRSVTLVLLWQEYRAEHPDGYGYSRFCDLYGEWRRSVSATMRQTHAAGEKLFVDFAGDTVAVIDPLNGDLRPAHIFVAALGASNFTYAEGRWSEGLADWISAHVNTLAAIGGVPRAVVCDNLKAGVTKPSRYEPGINRSYQELATHYGFAVLPTRIKKPRDKAKAEVAVQIVQRFVLARLRNRRFFSLDELNIAIRECVADLNDRIMRKLGKSRRELLETIERPAFKAIAGRTLSLCRVEAGSRRPRLPHRDRRPLLLGAFAAHPRGGRGAHHQRDGRDFPSRHARRQPRLLGCAQPAHDDPRTYAERASALCRVDASAPHARG